MEEDGEDRPRQRQSLKPVPKPLLSIIHSDGVEKRSEVVPEQVPASANEQKRITGQSPEETICPTAAAQPTAPTPQRAAGQGGVTFIEKDPNDTPSTPRHGCVASGPTASRLPALETNTDVFTVTPRRVPITNTTPGPSPLPLPMLPGLKDPLILPLINLQEATPMRLEQAPIQSDLSSNASSSPGPSPIVGLPGIVMPNLDNVDETVQRFFHQIVEHLNNMQMWQSSVSASTRSSSATPEFSIRDAPGMTLTPRLGPQDARTVIEDQATPESSDTMPVSSMAEHDPDEVRFQDATEESHVSSDPATDSEVLGLGISDYYRQGTRRALPVVRPLHQQQLRPPPPGRAYTRVRYSATKRSHGTSEDKENIKVQEGVMESEPLPLGKKSALRNSGENNKNLGDKRVHILLPAQEAEEPESKLKKGILSTQSGAYESS